MPRRPLDLGGFKKTSSFGLKNREKMNGSDVGIVFGPFRGRELTFVGLFCEFMNARV